MAPVRIEDPAEGDRLEGRIAEWRARVGGGVPVSTLEERERRLREEVSSLEQAGLDTDEAFLIAVRRIGRPDPESGRFTPADAGGLWKQLAARAAAGESGTTRREILIVLGLAVASAAAVKVPELFGCGMFEGCESFYARNLSLFCLPLLTAYFVWRRGLDAAGFLRLALPFAAAALLANIYPFSPGGSTEALTALHLPIALWLVVGVAHAGGAWASSRRRMEFVRFSGELFILYVLIALGGGVLTGVTGMMFAAIGLDVERLGPELLPSAALGAAVVAAWLADARHEAAANIAPLLTRIFTPLFAVVLLAFLGAMAWTGSGIVEAREVLIGFDLLLVVVLGLLLYGVSSRDPGAPPGLFDRLQLLLLLAALAVDAVALAAIGARISEFGFSANKAAALGENLVLLVNLAGSAWLYARFLRGRGTFSALERWQTAYLPVYAVWAGVVAVIFPPLFGYG